MGLELFGPDFELERQNEEDELGAGACGEGSSAEVAAMVGSMRTEDEIAEEVRLAAADDEVWRRKMNPW